MRKFYLGLSLLFISSSLLAAPLQLNYSLFFGYMKTLYKLELDHVTTAFYLRDKNSGLPCLIKQATVVVDEKYDPIKFAQEGRLLPFFSDQHRKDGAFIEVELLKPQQCSLQVTLMAKESELENVSTQGLLLISAELESLLKKNAGMIGQYFLPEFKGVRLQLNEALSMQQIRALDKQIKTANNGDLLVSREWLIETNNKVLPYQLKRITPWLMN